jgi:hypothetical protein
MFSIVDDPPETTIPPPTPDPLIADVPVPVNEDVALTIPPRTINVPTNVAFPETPGPAPIPVPPIDTIDPFKISSDWHLPFAEVPIPEPPAPPSTVREPSAAEARVMFEKPPHSIPVE